MSHTAKPWQPRDGTDPYGRPEKKGNADEVWKLLNVTPCPKCGAHAKRLRIEDGKATIVCGRTTEPENATL